RLLELVTPQQVVKAAFQRAPHGTQLPQQVRRRGRRALHIDPRGRLDFGRSRRGVGGQNFDTTINTAVGYDQGIGPQCQAYLTQGFAVGTSKESTDVHCAASPITAVIRNTLSCGSSVLANTPRCGKW